MHFLSEKERKRVKTNIIGEKDVAALDFCNAGRICNYIWGGVISVVYKILYNGRVGNG